MASSASSSTTTTFSWRSDVSDAALLNDRAWLHGGMLANISYGINIALFVLTFTVLHARSSRERSRQTTLLQGYISLVFALCTLSIGAQTLMADDRGGYSASQKGAVVAVVGNVCFAVMNWIASGLLIWRCVVIYKNSTAPLWLVMCVPKILLLTSLVTGIIYLVHLSHLASLSWTSTTLTLIYAVARLSLKMTLTLMIVIRLYFYRRRITQLVGSKYAGHYTSLVSMLIESAAVMDVMTIFFIVAFALRSPVVDVPLQANVQIEAIAAYMIVFRVAQGTAWSSGTVSGLIAAGDLGRPGSSEERVDVAALRFRVTSQMTQTSTVLNFYHAHSPVSLAGSEWEDRKTERPVDVEAARS
ncbi:hypothetical protein BDZ97DRAFT_1799334 [Flammula alnicola]|nr:hypothetical protein BDZ97DRAFT_1799334 [Flammula alnicola]